MSPTHFLPAVRLSYARLRSDAPALMRAGLPAMVIGFAVPAISLLPFPGADLMAMVLNALAFGVFGVAWMRFIAAGEAPGRPVHLRLGKREIMVAVFSEIMGMFTAVPLILTAMMTDATGTHEWAPLLGPVAVQLFLVLMGAAYLLLPDAALAVKGQPGRRLHEIVQAGGLSVGIAYVLAGLPFTLVVVLVGALVPAPEGLPARLALQGVVLVPSILSAAAGWGVLAMCWKELKAA
ncbi:MAG: hypothetical protein ACM33T_07695 [Solirubrobacterales bacterium]